MPSLLKSPYDSPFSWGWWRWGNPNVINVFFEIEGRAVCDICPGVVGNDRDVIAELVLVRITEERVKRIADCDIGRPGISAVEAVRIEELRVGVVRGVARVQPDGIDSAIRRDGKRAEPVPLRVINRIVIDPARRAEGLAAVCAAHKHHVTAGGSAGGLDAREHVNIVVRARAGTIHRQKNLPDQSFWIDRLARGDIAAEIDRGALVESWD